MHPSSKSVLRSLISYQGGHYSRLTRSFDSFAPTTRPLVLRSILFVRPSRPLICLICTTIYQFLDAPGSSPLAGISNQASTCSSFSLVRLTHAISRRF
ncbi:hypothetical protein ILYODFUR_006854 [Ilyodon furcidens]|uniref:Uncharacterized protein n=1 Tax=Ilyodon furcidens TaxID=33524 RepID=A0ABV0SYH1_9TELE